MKYKQTMLNTIDNGQVPFALNFEIHKIWTKSKEDYEFIFRTNFIILTPL